MKWKLLVRAFALWLFLIVAFPLSVTAQGTPESKSEKPSNTVSRPTCLKCPPPEFPDKARKSKIKSGKVLLEITISAEGRVANLHVLEDPGYGFAEKAVAAVKNWKFKPALSSDGRKVSTTVQVEVVSNWM